MQSTLDTLNNFLPLIILCFLTLFMTLETWRPYYKYGTDRRRQRMHNVCMLIITMAIGALTGVFVAAPIVWSETHNFGLMHRFAAPAAVTIVAGILLLDLCSFALHVIQHKVPALWRIHRVHHADTALDASSGVRLHPFELIYLLSLQAVGAALLGIPMASYVVYNAVAVPWFTLNHSNVKFPRWFERWGSLFMSTPDWHRVHHSSFNAETDSHYGCLFSLWDRLFGTTRKAEVESLRFGLETFRDSRDQTVWQLLKMPFREL
jgi:sterol desaturase/sphingolipid hydroxylase (fatty acid hydroxylase superfamily)